MNKKRDSKVSKSDLEIWKEYIKNPNDIFDKDINKKKSATPCLYKFDLHGYSLIDANNKAKEVGKDSQNLKLKDIIKQIIEQKAIY